MRFRTGFKEVPIIKQYWADNNEETGFYQVINSGLSGSTSVCGTTFSTSSINAGTTSGRYYECLFNGFGQPGPSSPYLFSSTVDMNDNFGTTYGTNTTASYCSTNLSSSLSNGQTVGIAVISASFYASGTLAPLPNRYYHVNGIWYQISGGAGMVVDRGIVKNIRSSNITNSGTSTMNVYRNGTGQSVPNGGAFYYITGKNGDTIFVNFPTTGSLMWRYLQVMKNNTIILNISSSFSGSMLMTASFTSTNGDRYFISAGTYL